MPVILSFFNIPSTYLFHQNPAVIRADGKNNPFRQNYILHHALRSVFLSDCRAAWYASVKVPYRYQFLLRVGGGVFPFNESILQPDTVDIQAGYGFCPAYLRFPVLQNRLPLLFTAVPIKVFAILFEELVNSTYRYAPWLPGNPKKELTVQWQSNYWLYWM